jgi:hypothetical protein
MASTNNIQGFLNSAEPDDAKPTPKRIRIMLEDNADIPPTGQFVSVNGRTYMVQPGKWFDAPQELINVLDDAVATVPILDPNTQRVIGYRDRLRFPYRVHNSHSGGTARG